LKADVYTGQSGRDTLLFPFHSTFLHFYMISFRFCSDPLKLYGEI